MDSKESRFSRQIKKGVMEMLVLKLLSEKQGYGYDLLLRLSSSPNGMLEVKEGTLYPILYRLEDENCLKSSWVLEEGKSSPKKVYTITDKGREYLKMQREVWCQFTGDVSYVMER